jgi:hypothetical protein
VRLFFCQNYTEKLQNQRNKYSDAENFTKFGTHVADGTHQTSKWPSLTFKHFCIMVSRLVSRRRRNRIQVSSQEVTACLTPASVAF